MAPEMVRNEPYTNKVDVWALGVLAYALMCGYTPFDGDTDEEIMVCPRMRQLIDSLGKRRARGYPIP